MSVCCQLRAARIKSVAGVSSVIATFHENQVSVVINVFFLYLVPAQPSSPLTGARVRRV